MQTAGISNIIGKEKTNEGVGGGGRTINLVVLMSVFRPPTPYPYPSGYELNAQGGVSAVSVPDLRLPTRVVMHHLRREKWSKELRSGPFDGNI